MFACIQRDTSQEIRQSTDTQQPGLMHGYDATSILVDGLFALGTSSDHGSNLGMCAKLTKIVPTYNYNHGDIARKELKSVALVKKL